MPGGSSNPNRGSGYGGNRSSGGKGDSSKGSSDGGKGHYYGEMVRTVGQAAIRYADAKEQVDKTKTSTKERTDALKELEDAGRNLNLVE